MWSVTDSSCSFASEHPEPVIEHMVTLVKSPEKILVRESWYHTQSKNERHDEFEYSFADSEEIGMGRTIVKEQGKQIYRISKKQDKVTEDTGTGPYYTTISPGKTLFQSTTDAYRTTDWTSAGTVQIDGERVEKMIREVRDPVASYTEIVYLKQTTGLPVVKEYYKGRDLKKPLIAEAFFFEKVDDPAGALFTIPDPQKHKQIIKHVTQITKSSNIISFSKSWQHPQNGDERYEFFNYDFSFKEGVSQQWIVNKQGTKFFHKRKEGGEVTVNTERKPGNFIPAGLSLFQNQGGREWEFVGTVNYNRKMTQVYKQVDTEPKGTTTIFAYVDRKTGLPMKEEIFWTYWDEEYYAIPKKEPQSTSIYFFENVQDPTGTLFSIPKK
jgi:hypothetical protein